MTGHANGLITINIAEADRVERERPRVALGEPYRTLLGHLRHEAGHYYWDLLVGDGGRHRGDAGRSSATSRESYGEALRALLSRRAEAAGWEDGHVSAYATMHPWEDFAETWTHYLHMVDTLDTGASFGLSVNPVVGEDPRHAAVIDFDPYQPPDLEEPDAGLAAADRRGQQPQPQHGPARPLPVRPEPERRRQGRASSTNFCIRRATRPGRAVRRLTMPRPRPHRGTDTMRIFTCQNCGQLLHFENTVCMRCGLPLGFLPASLTLSALTDEGDGLTAMADGGSWQPCAQRQPGALQLAGARTTTRPASARPARSTAPSPTSPSPATSSAGRRWRRRSGG